MALSFSDKGRRSLRQSVAELNIEHGTCLQQAGKEVRILKRWNMGQ